MNIESGLFKSRRQLTIAAPLAGLLLVGACAPGPSAQHTKSSKPSVSREQSSNIPLGTPSANTHSSEPKNSHSQEADKASDDGELVGCYAISGWRKTAITPDIKRYAKALHTSLDQIAGDHTERIQCRLEVTEPEIAQLSVKALVDGEICLPIGGLDEKDSTMTAICS